MTTNKVNNDDLINSILKTSSTKAVGTTSKSSKTSSTGSCCSGKTYDSADETVKLNISSKSCGCSKTSGSTVGQQKYGGTVVAMLDSPVTTKCDSMNFISTYLGANTSKLKNAQYDSSGRVTYYEDSGWSCKHKQQNSYSIDYLKSGATKVTTQNGCQKEVSIYDYISQSGCGCGSTKKSTGCSTKKTDTSGCGCSTKKTDTSGCSTKKVDTSSCGCSKQQEVTIKDDCSCNTTKKNTGCSQNSGNITNKTINVDETLTRIQDSYNTVNSNNQTSTNVNVNQNITNIQDSYNTINSNNTTTNNYTKNVNVTSNVNSNNKINVTKNVNVVNNVNNGIIDKSGNDIYDGEGNDIYANNNRGIIDTAGNDTYARNQTTNNVSVTKNITNNITVKGSEDPDPEDPDPPVDPDPPKGVDLMPLRNLLVTLDHIKKNDGKISDNEMNYALSNPTLADMDGDTSTISSDEKAILNEVKTFSSDNTLITNLFNGNYDAIDSTTLTKLQTLSDKIKALKG